MMELFCEINQILKTVNYFHKKSFIIKAINLF